MQFFKGVLDTQCGNSAKEVTADIRDLALIMYRLNITEPTFPFLMNLRLPPVQPDFIWIPPFRCHLRVDF